ncbi:DUF1003 domain-containing protein [Phenylobacterium deserti]|uniref:DUF1003 domain-containing protein n=1 Tax=Phenylobacterium deserti TaxID=1914756 RepID=A0A328A9X9_9CAUL|nr:DUF1003 domain-containing protein [Phenylobacterium deserti]RAK51440.1 hypothetical protein DJ018_16010 [Phenylobacterium deserti]
MGESAHRNEHLAQELLGCGYGELSPVQKSVIDLIATEQPTGVSRELRVDDRSFGERLADNVAAVGGSWTFIVAFAVLLAGWMAWNAWGKGHHLAFDPFPFIFLNLMLSMIAALQAPVIMMSQNRAAARDRQAAEHDYVVNLRAELEIMRLHDKIDVLRQREILELLKRQSETIRLLRQQVQQLTKD